MAEFATRRSDDGKTLWVEGVLAAPRSAVWRAWTEPALVMDWFCPKPWRVSSADFDLQPGGRMNTVMEGPNGERFENEGVWLEVVPETRLAFTDYFSEGFVPRAEPFMASYVQLEARGDADAFMIWGARHATREIADKHLEMGFEAGWPAAAAQLEETAQRVAAGG